MNLNQSDKPVAALCNVDLRCFSIALVPIFIFWINNVISNHLMPDDLNVPIEILQEGRHWLEAAGRYRFLAATWFFASLTVLAVALLARSLMRPLTPKTRVASIITMGVILWLAVIPLIQHSGSADGTKVYYRLGSELFETALSRGSVPGCNDTGDSWLLGACGELPVLSLFNRVMDIVNVLAGLGVGALIVGMILCLQTCEGNNIEEEAAQLAHNLRQMRQQLYLSSLILTFGVFYAASWMYWPEPLVIKSERGAYSSVVLASALFMGTYFSLLILSFYLPVALVLDSRVRKLADVVSYNAKSKEPLDVQSWRASRGLKESAIDYLRAGFAATAPILAAFAGGISPLAL